MASNLELNQRPKYLGMQCCKCGSRFPIMKGKHLSSLDINGFLEGKDLVCEGGCHVKTKYVPQTRDEILQQELIDRERYELFEIEIPKTRRVSKKRSAQSARKTPSGRKDFRISSGPLSHLLKKSQPRSSNKTASLKKKSLYEDIFCL